MYLCRPEKWAFTRFGFHKAQKSTSKGKEIKKN